MSRLSIQKIDGVPNFKPAGKGHGAKGQILKKTIFGRNFSVSLNGTKTKLNRGSLIDYLNAEAQKVDSLKNRKLEKGLFFGSSNAEITALFNDVVNALPDQQSSAANQLEDTKKKHSQMKAEIEADKKASKKIQEELGFSRIPEERDCQLFKSQLPQYQMGDNTESFLLHTECLRDRYPEDEEYIALRDQLQVKLIEKMHTFSESYLTFTDDTPLQGFIGRLRAFYPSREEALKVVSQTMSQEAGAYLEEGWKVEKIPTREEWLEETKM